jgi:hypothetical protein
MRRRCANAMNARTATESIVNGFKFQSSCLNMRTTQGLPF